MSWFQTLVHKFNPIQEDIAYSEAGSGYSYTNITSVTAPNEIGIVKRCIELITDAASEVPLVLYKHDSEGELTAWTKSKFGRFLISPNSHYDKTQFYSNLIQDLIIDGNAFIYVDKEGLYHIPAVSMAIIEDPNTYISGYKFTAAGKSKVYARNNIIHIRLNNSASIYRGIGKLTPIEKELNIYKAMLRYQETFFINAGIPRVLLRTANFLNPKTKKRMLSDWKEAHSALQNKANGTAILDGGLDAQVLDSSFKDSDFNAGVTRLEQYVAIILGVPWVLISSGNNANIRNNQRLFYNHTVMPLMNRISSAITSHIHRVSPRTVGQLSVKPDSFAVEALRPDQKEQASTLATLVNGGIITPNEARKPLRKPPIDGLDEIRIPANIAGSAVNPNTGGRPPKDKPTKESR